MVRQVRALATCQPERTHIRKEPIPESCLLTSMSINACLHACINVKKKIEENPQKINWETQL